MTAAHLAVATAPHPGAVGICQLHGPGSRDLLRQVTGRRRFDDDRLYLVNFADIDEGLAVCRGDDWAQLMPHGGVRVVEKLVDKLVALGATLDPDPDPRTLYPEADSAIEADMLAALAASPSPAAIDLLLAQPKRWRQAPRSHAGLGQALDYLLQPATVVVVGAPNVGKSTLTNAILGRRASLVSELPGTTRDWVGSLAEVAGVAVRWIDTPGVRESSDPIERAAIRLAATVVERADVLIAMRDAAPGSEYPKLPREPDLRVVNKVDDAQPTDAHELPISALHDRNLDLLQQRVLRVLGLDVLSNDTLWAFSPTLKRHAAGEQVDLQGYLYG